jgi:hypothetical protein
VNIPETIVRAILLAAKNSLEQDDAAHVSAVKARTAIDVLVLDLTAARTTKATLIGDLEQFLRRHPNTAPTPLPPPPLELPPGMTLPTRLTPPPRRR